MNDEARQANSLRIASLAARIARDFDRMASKGCAPDTDRLQVLKTLFNAGSTCTISIEQEDLIRGCLWKIEDVLRDSSQDFSKMIAVEIRIEGAFTCLINCIRSTESNARWAAYGNDDLRGAEQLMGGLQS